MNKMVNPLETEWQSLNEISPWPTYCRGLFPNSTYLLFISEEMFHRHYIHSDVQIFNKHTLVLLPVLQGLVYSRLHYETVLGLWSISMTGSCPVTRRRLYPQIYNIYNAQSEINPRRVNSLHYCNAICHS